MQLVSGLFEMAEKQLFHARKLEKSKYVGLEKGSSTCIGHGNVASLSALKTQNLRRKKLLGDRCVDMGILEGSLKGLTGNRELSFCNSSSPASVVWRQKIRW